MSVRSMSTVLGRSLRRAGLPVALTAVTAAVGTLLAGGVAHAAPKPTPSDRGDSINAAKTAIAGLRAKAGDASTRATDELNFGDLDGDGKADLAAVDATGTLWVYPGKATVYPGSGPRSTSYFAARFEVGRGWGGFTALVRHGDWNNDGKQDILARDAQGRLFLYAGTGNRGAVVKKGVQVGTGWNPYTSIAGVGDVNNDGFDDLFGVRDGYLVLYKGTGNGAQPFRNDSYGGNGWDGDLFTSVGDWTGDGRSEYLFRNIRSDISLYESTRGSEFPQSKPIVKVVGEAGAYVTNLVGMGNLVSDAPIGGQPVNRRLPDAVMTDTDGYLYLMAPDTGNDLNPVVGRGWGGYRLF